MTKTENAECVSTKPGGGERRDEMHADYIQNDTSRLPTYVTSFYSPALNVKSPNGYKFTKQEQINK